MCDAEKDWHERSFRASGAFGSRQKLPFNKPEISFSFFIVQPAVHYDENVFSQSWLTAKNVYVCVHISQSSSQ